MGRFGAMVGSAPARVGAAAVALALVASLTNPASAARDEDKPGRDAPAVQRTKAVDGKRVTGRAAEVRAAHDPVNEVRWPAAAREQVAVPDSEAGPVDGKSAPPAFTRAGNGPVFVGDPRSKAARKTGAPAAARNRVPAAVNVQVADRKATAAAGVAGVLVALTPAAGSAAGPVAVRVDYTDFAAAYGGDWGLRLRAVRYPACILTAPDVPACTIATALPATNDAEAGTVTTVIDLSTPDPAATPTPPATEGPTRLGRGFSRVTTTDTGSGGVVGLESGAASENGDFGATPLSESFTWSAGGQSGAATWSYPIPVPPVPGGLGPQLAIGYNSQAVDGRTSGRNNQGSWVGDGFDLSPGFIERKYRPCVDDQIPKDQVEPNNPDGAGGVTPTGDLCWKSDNATLSFGGSTSELIFDDSPGKGYWRKVFDDGTRITRENLGANAIGNGDEDGEYWTLTTPNGVRYFFGSGEERTGVATNSVWTVPVYGNHPATATEPKEPGYQPGDFAASSTTQAWRWNLDFVRDLTGNAVTYVWRAETNYYNRGTTYLDQSGGTRTAYVRGGTLDHIDYGLRVEDVSEPPTNRTNPPARVLFDVSERCRVAGDPTAQCQEIQADDHPDWWPDVPLDQLCKSSGTCDNFVPTFFGRKRLIQILTQLDPPGAPELTAVDQFDIAYADTNQLFPATLTHTAKKNLTDTSTDNDVDIPLAVTFSRDQFPNSVDGAGSLALLRWRLLAVIDEAGQAVGFVYKQPECTGSNIVDLDPWNNTMLCFPARYIPPNAPSSDGVLRWFHKYVVASARVSDNSGAADAVEGSNSVVTRYDYSGAAWAYDRSPIVRTEDRTWNDWRGFRQVDSTTGDLGTTQQTRMLTTTRYYQGMYEDRADPDGGQRQKTFDVSTATNIPDSWRFAGMARETKVYSDPDGAAEHKISTTATIPWQLPTSPAVRTPTLAGVEETHTITELAGLNPGDPARTPRTTKTTYIHDTYGFVTSLNDYADQSIATDDLCTTITYTRPPLASTGPWILDRVATARTLSDCGASPPIPASVVNETRNYYDGATSTTAVPSQGLLTRVDQVEVAGGGGTAEKAVRTDTGYDTYGRMIWSTAPSTLDAEPGTNPRKSQTAYAPSAGPATNVTVTSPDPDGAGAGTPHVSTTTLDPFRGLPLTKTDPNGIATRASYDALGRLLKVWRDNRATTSTPDVQYVYGIRAGGPESVTTKARVDDDRGERVIDSVVLYDDLRRAVQTQTPSYQEEGSPSEGRVVASTGYDTRGLPVVVSHPTFTEGDPDPDAYWKPAVEQQGQTNTIAIPAQTTTVYDGLGRPISETFTAALGPTWTTTTAYYGDRVTVTPPTGAVKTTTVTDARGRTTSLIQDPRGDGGDARKTTYTWTPAGQMATMADPGPNGTGAGANTWSWTYDLLGRQLKAEDPDAGTTTKTYTPTGALAKVTDARTQVISYAYDNLDRQIERWSGPVGTGNGGAKLASWTYDPYVADLGKRLNGLPDASIRYENGTPITRQITGYDALARPTEVTTTIPEVANLIPSQLTGDYVTKTAYNGDGSVKTTELGSFGPSFGRIEAETLHYYNDQLGRPQALTGAGAYVADVLRSPFGDVLRYSYGNTFRREAWQKLTYQPGTRRLLTSQIDREIDATAYETQTYAYDNAGNPTQIATTGQPGTETRCFDYDGFGQLTAAWTPAGGSCSSVPEPNANPNPTLGGVAKYGYSWTFDGIGNRTSETDYRGTNPATTTYTYDANVGALPGPHQLTGISGARSGNFQYDTAGNTTTRVLDGQTQNLTWDPEGRLQSVTAAGGSGAELARHLYDADGSRLIRRDSNGTTLYLDDSTEITLNTAGNAATWQRHYSFNGQTVAVRYGNKMTQADILIADPQNTAQHAINTATSAATARRTLPYGAGRDASGATGVDPPAGWNSHGGFVGAITDTATDLLHIKARDYDPTLGRFLSIDPIMNSADPLQVNPYGYANNNPATYRDPTGTRTCEDDCGPGEAVYNSDGSLATTQELAPVGQSASPASSPVTFTEDQYVALRAPMIFEKLRGSVSQVGVSDQTLMGAATRQARGEFEAALAPDPFGAFVGLVAATLGGVACGAVSGGALAVACFAAVDATANGLSYSLSEGDKSVAALFGSMAIGGAGGALGAGLGAAVGAAGRGARAAGTAAETGPKALTMGPWGEKVLQARGKLPESWGPGTPNTKGVGTRWFDPASPQGSGVRIDQGIPGSGWPSQQVDHVVVRSGGRIIGPDGKPIVGSLRENPSAHIPLSDWLTWRTWNAP